MKKVCNVFISLLTALILLCLSGCGSLEKFYEGEWKLFMVRYGTTIITDDAEIEDINARLVMYEDGSGKLSVDSINMTFDWIPEEEFTFLFDDGSEGEMIKTSDETIDVYLSDADMWLAFEKK